MKIRTMIGLIALLFIAAPVWAAKTDKHEQEESKIHFHGYGEVHHNNPAGSGFPDETKPATMDLHRLVWGISYSVNDQWSLHSKIDFGHASKEIDVRAAYLEYQAEDYIAGFRAGSLLLPVGPLNEASAPNLFYSVERPYVQKLIIPTSWTAGGAGFFGEMESGFKFRVYLVEGLNAAKFDEKGIGEGRQLLDGKNNSDKFGWVGRLEYAGISDLVIGASYYDAAAVGVKGAGVSLWDVDLRYKVAGFDFSALLARSTIKEAGAISIANGKAVGADQIGQYGEIAYHLNQISSKIPNIVPFYRVEQFSTKKSKPNEEVHTYGLAYYPNSKIVMKIDKEQWKKGSGEKAKRINVGIGFIF